MEQLADFLVLLDTQTPVEQVVDVPKISQDITLPRSVDLDPQMVEQLVEVPTVLTYSSTQQHTAEQNVDIPVRGPRLRGGLLGFSPKTGFAAHSGAHVTLEALQVLFMAL